MDARRIRFFPRRHDPDGHREGLRQIGRRDRPLDHAHPRLPPRRRIHLWPPRRSLFFIGGLPAWLARIVRTRVEELNDWSETRHETWRHLVRAIASNLKLFLYLVVLMAMMNMVSHGTQDMYPTFLQRDWDFGPRARAAVTAISQVGALAGGVLCGLYSDRLGRRRTIGLALAGAVLSLPMWAFAPVTPLLVLGAFVMQFFVL